MESQTSDAVIELRQLAAADPLREVDALEALFAEIGEDLTDAIQSGGRERLAALRRELRRVYSLVAVREDDKSEETLPFVLGRVASLLELAGSAARRQRRAGFGRELDDERTLQVLELLREKEMASSELTERLGIDKAAVSRRLRKLEAAGLLIRQMSGRRLYSRLTPAARQALRERQGRVAAVGRPERTYFGHYGEEDISALVGKPQEAA